MTLLMSGRRCRAEMAALQHDCGETEDTEGEQGEEVPAPTGEGAATGASHAELTVPPHPPPPHSSLPVTSNILHVNSFYITPQS